MIGGSGHHENSKVLQEEEIFNLHDFAETQIFGLDQVQKNYERQGFVTNFKEVLVKDEEENIVTCLMLTVLDSGGDWFTCYVKQDPYFFIKVESGIEPEILNFLEKKYERLIKSIQVIEKKDLDVLNHLSGIKTKYLKISFRTMRNLAELRKEMKRQVVRNSLRKKTKSLLSGSNLMNEDGHYNNYQSSEEAILKTIEDIKEHDVDYVTRVAIDKNIRAGKWYNITCRNGFVTEIVHEPSLIENPFLRILAFDIETTKQPLKFPDSKIDEIMLISYVVDGEACLIVNRSIFSEDIVEFTYNPHKDIDYDIIIYNEPDEKACIQKFFHEIKENKPMVLTTFNGDNFDWPFIYDRALIHEIDMTKEIGVIGYENTKRALLKKVYKGQLLFVHLDCYHWVKRDAYLPQGSHGLKKVTKAKLGYDPIEVSPELMVEMASSNPQKLCEYSISDAVATYHLYIKHIHDFILALCTIVPSGPEMVLRNGSGVLCEKLLMAQAFSDNIVFPSKKNSNKVKYFDNHPIESETYVGGYVECINEGVYRADFETDFHMSAKGYSYLIENANEVMKFFVENESNMSVDDIENYEEVLEDIRSKLWSIKSEIEQKTVLNLKPLIYHIDVAAMYPNIILTNRLQPTAIVNEKTCCNCIFNRAENDCKRKLGWEYKVTYFPISQKEYEMIERQNSDSSKDDLKKAIKIYSQKNYKKIHETKIKYKEDTICMRENSFYVDTIRDFRDRRKSKEEKEKGNFESANEEQNLSTLYDSLQLAHKIILNSFYGYVMKKNARWYSMEMAAMVTHTGAKIIQSSRDLLEKVGKVLELDTDGVWTLLPEGFPEKYQLKTKKGKKLYFAFPCSVMNHLIFDKFKNQQYQDKVTDKEYSKRTEMSIYFELDGPYKAMVIPASIEENKKLKKRYCVFNFNGKISEIKGFELKRRGELEIIKKFQREIFSKFLMGSTLKECYQICGDSAQMWMDIILKKGEGMNEEGLFELLGESKVLSKNIEEYGDQKGVALTTAKRMARYLGDSNVFASAGMRLDFIISKQPESQPVSQRAIPIDVFKLPKETKMKLLREWLEYPENCDFTLKSILDWNYYFERFAKNIQKIITIPAILQGLDNPMKDIPNPNWLNKRLKIKNQKEKQTDIQKFFMVKPKTIKDVENLVIPKFEKKIEKKEEIFTEELMERPINIRSEQLNQNKSFGKFNMKLLKQKWKKKIEQRKKGIHTKTNTLTNMKKYLFQKVENCKWRILKCDVKSYGDILLHVLVDDKYLEKILINKKRKIFINFFEDQKNDKWSLIKKKLPRDKKSWFVYEIQVDEKVFREEFKGLDFFLTNYQVEGVYESQIDLDFHLRKDLGIETQIYKNDRNQLSLNEENKEFRISSDCMRKMINFEKSSSLKLRIFDDNLFETKKTNFCIVWSIKKNQKSAVFVWGNKKAFLILKNDKSNFQKNKKKKNVEFKNYLQNKINKMMQEFEISKDQIYKLELIYIDDNLEGECLISKAKQAVEHFVSRETSSMSIIIHSSNYEFEQDVENDFLSKNFQIPIMNLKMTIGEENKSKLNSLTWKKSLCMIGFKEFFKIFELVPQLDKLASFSQVPVCNLKGSLTESLIIAMDHIFARKLDQYNYISWFSFLENPDLGQRGVYKSENKLLELDIDEENIQMNENLNSKGLVRPGFYITHVVQLKLEMFVMNALINAVYFEDNDMIERMDMKVDERNMFLNPNLREAEFETNNAIAFKIIKELLVFWYQKIKLEEDESADLLITNIMSWMVSPESKFFDPLIKKKFLKTISRSFDFLLIKIEEMGGSIVLADHNKILINSKRGDFENAKNFTEYIVKNLENDPKFEYLSISPEKFFSLFILKNKYDYIGVEIGKNENSFEIYSFLNVHRFFPLEMKRVFKGALEYFLNETFKILSEIQSKSGEKTENEVLESFKIGFNSFIQNQFADNLLKVIEYIKENLKKEQQKKLETQDLNTKFNELTIGNQSQHNKKKENKSDYFEEFENESDYENDSFLESDEEQDVDLVKKTNENKENIKNIEENEWEYKEVVGQRRELKNLTLEFINAVFSVLCPTSYIHFDSLRVLKQNLLKFIGKDYFSDEAEFEKIAFSFEIHEVKCQTCRVVSSIDIFRDLSENLPSIEKLDDEQLSPYSCVCGERYPVTNIEKLIIQRLNDKILNCLNEDSYCNRCSQMKLSMFVDICDCSGSFAVRNGEFKKEIKNEIMNGLKNFRQLANVLRMNNLRMFCESIVF